MTAVVIKPGSYWVGDPTLIDPNWKESLTCTYSLNNNRYYAFRYNSGPVAVIPMGDLPEDAWESILIIIQPDVVTIGEVSIVATPPKTKTKSKKTAIPVSEFVPEPVKPEPKIQNTRRLKPQFAQSLVVFEEDTIFFEHKGKGYIGDRTF